MKLFLLALSVSTLTLGAADFTATKVVYVLPMSGGLDQHLAGRLTSARVFQVVADPKKADAVFTDQLGPAFEARLAELRGEKPEKEKGEAKKSDRDRSSTGDLKADTVTVFSTWSRSKGNIFLVDARSREVLWSLWQRSRGTGSEQLDRTASDIVSRLKQDLKSASPKPVKAKPATKEAVKKEAAKQETPTPAAPKK